MTLQNTSSQTRLTDNLARNGISMMPGTFQVFGVNELGRFKGNQTLYENKALLAPAPATTLDYNQTMARFAQPTGINATAVPGALPGALPGTIPGLPLGNFTIPGFAPDNTSSTPMAGMQPGFNLSDFQVPTQSLLPAGAVPFGANMTQPAQEPPAPPPTRSSASSGVIGAFTVITAAAAALLL